MAIGVQPDHAPDFSSSDRGRADKYFAKNVSSGARFIYNLLFQSHLKIF